MFSKSNTKKLCPEGLISFLVVNIETRQCDQGVFLSGGVGAAYRLPLIFGERDQRIPGHLPTRQ